MPVKTRSQTNQTTSQYTDSEFKQLKNVILHVSSDWSFHNLLEQFKYQIRTYIISYDDTDLNIIYTPDIDDLKKIYRILKKNCIKPKHHLFIKLNDIVSQP